MIARYVVPFAIALSALNGCKQTHPSSEVLGNGADLSESENPAIVRIISSGVRICTGTIINAKPQVLTAAHCVSSRRAPPKTPPAGSPAASSAASSAASPGGEQNADTDGYGVGQSPVNFSVSVLGQDVAVEKIDVNPEYLKTASPADDLAVLTLPAGTKIPTPKQISMQQAAVGMVVDQRGYGVTRPDWHEDPDGDEISNGDDYCPSTPSESKKSVTQAGERKGCAEGETPDRTWVAQVDRNKDEKLRGGENTVQSVQGGLIRVQGPLTGIAPAGEVTPGPGDSGGPLFGPDGKLVGTVQGGKKAQGAGSSIHNVEYVDLSSASSQNFLRTVQ